MTKLPEAKLAREAEIRYCTVAMVTDYDCWHPDHDDVTVEMILNNLNSNAELAKKIIISAAKQIGKIRPKSLAHDALKYALITPKDKIPQKTLKKISIFTKKYWE